MNHILKGLLAITFYALCCNSFADKLTLQDGQTLEGTLVGRSDGMVIFSIAGQELKIPESNIAALEVTSFGGSAAPPPAPEAAPAAAPPAPAPEAEPQSVTVPTGTRLVLRMTQALDSKKHQTGHRFTAKLEADLVTNGVVVATRGTTVYGALMSAKSSGRMAGSSELTAVFTDILIDNQMHPISTQPMQARTENTAKKSAKRTAGASALGGLYGGSSSAKKGAKVGLGASILTSGNQIHIPAGTLVETQLTAPFTVD